jgi:hypothetical protein
MKVGTKVKVVDSFGHGFIIGQIVECIGVDSPLWANDFRGPLYGSNIMADQLLLPHQYEVVED